MKVCVTGSRHWPDETIVWQRLDEVLEEHPNMELIHGKSPGGGVDEFAEAWANARGVVQWPVPVRAGGTGIDGNWPYAGLKRNTRMLTTHSPDLVIGFRAPGKSNGTDHCLKEAERLNVPDIEIVYYEPTA